MGLADTYCNDLKNNFKVLYATWPPTTPMKLGDYGKLDGKVFVKQGNIRDDFNIPFSTNIDPTPDESYEYQSSKAVNTDLVAGVAGIVKAGINISFSKEGAVYFVAADCYSHLMGNQPTTIEQVTALFKQKKLKGYHVVVNVIEAGAATIIVSGSKTASIGIEAKTDLIGNLNLRDPSMDFNIKSERNIGFKIISKKGYTPLIGLSKIST